MKHTIEERENRMFFEKDKLKKIIQEKVMKITRL